MTLRDRVAAWDADRRLLALGLVVLLVILGSGVGTLLVSDGPDDVPGEVTPTPTPAETPPSTTTPDEGDVAPTGGSDDPSDPTDDRTDTETSTDRSEDTDRSDDDDRSTSDSDSEDDGGGSTPAEPPAIALNGTGEGTLLDTDGVLPGDRGNGTVTLENDGVENGRLRIVALDVRDRENGFTEPEVEAGDTDDEGELSEHLEVRIAIVGSDGNQRYVLGTAGGDGHQTLADLPGRAPSTDTSIAPNETVTVRVDWRLPASTGNEVQSDGVVFDVTFELRSRGE